MKRGTILFHTNLRYKNGESGKKLLVILNNQSGKNPFLMAKTTTNERNKSRIPGCIQNESLFFIESGKTWFNDDTWIQLFEVYPFTASEALKDKFDGYLEVKDILPVQVANEIKNCLKRLIDFPVKYKKIILKK